MSEFLSSRMKFAEGMTSGSSVGLLTCKEVIFLKKWGRAASLQTRSLFM